MKGSAQPLVSRYTDNLEAYDLYLRGNQHFLRLTAEGMRTAVEYFELAKELDPQYPLPYVGVARYYSANAPLGIAPPREFLDKAEAELKQALEIDPTVADAHRVLGMVRQWQWDWAGAEAAFKQAIALEPGNADNYAYYAQLLSWLARADESISMARRAVDLDPVSPLNRSNLARCFSLVRQYDQAAEQARTAIDLEPGYYLGYLTLGDSLIQQGQLDEAIQAFEQSRALAADDPIPEALLGEAYGYAGRHEEAHEILSKMERRRKESYAPAMGIAYIQKGLGDDDAMFAWLETAYQDGDPNLGILKADPAFDSHRSDPRFRDLLERVHFPE